MEARYVRVDNGEPVELAGVQAVGCHAGNYGMNQAADWICLGPDGEWTVPWHDDGSDRDDVVWVEVVEVSNVD
jgi:hypothetical protein